MILPDCTIIIPTRNRAADLEITLDRLCAEGLGETPVIIVDDASDDPARTHAAASKLGNVRFVDQAERTGQAGARNRGLEGADTTYCLFFDDDAHLENAAPLLAFLSSGLDAGTAVWRFETIRECDGYRDGIPASMPETRLHTFIGFGVLMRRRAVLDAGGYRDYLRYRHEEEDLAVRLFRAGQSILYRPGVRFIHRHSPAARSSLEYDFLSARNLFLLYAMNWPLPVAPLLGAAKVASLILKTRTRPLTKLRGFLAGLVTATANLPDRTPLSFRQVRDYRALRADVARERERYSTTLTGGNKEQDGD